MTEASVPPISSDAPLSVLFVCTGNVCRSPFAELLLRHRAPGISVASSGIYALVGSPMDAQMAHLLSLRGIGAGGFHARQVSATDMDADLVLTMSERERAFLVDEFPSVARRVGLLGHVPQLTQLAGGGPLTRQDIATWTRMAKPQGQGVVDPYGRDMEVASSSAERIEALVDQLAAVLGPAQNGGIRAVQGPPTRL